MKMSADIPCPVEWSAFSMRSRAFRSELAHLLTETPTSPSCVQRDGVGRSIHIHIYIYDYICVRMHLNKYKYTLHIFKKTHAQYIYTYYT